MRKFKLLKDLPAIDAGTVLTEKDGYGGLLFFDEDLGKDSGLTLHNRAFGVTLSIRGVCYETTAVEEWLEEIRPEYKRWRGSRGNYYFLVTGVLSVDQDTELGSHTDTSRYRYGNYFQTEEEAQAHADYLKALAVVRDDAKGFKPDWESPETNKYIVGLHHITGTLTVATHLCAQDNGVFGLPYFETREDAQRSIDIHPDQWKTIFGINKKEEE